MSEVRPVRSRGFTLVELLVVIGIIALLISILLPSLNSARRSAEKLKCMSNMRQIGMSYFQYANDNKGWWPAAWHNYKSPTGAARQKRWHDFIGKYLTGYVINEQGTQNATVEPQIWTVKDRNNVLWAGCPAWQRVTLAGGGISLNNNFHPGYTMAWYPKSPGDFASGNFADVRKARVYVDESGTLVPGVTTGRYFKMNEWSKPSERALLVESTHGNLAMPLADITGPWQYAPTGTAVLPAVPDAVTLSVDYNRHGRKPVGNGPLEMSMNILMCDGHVVPGSYRDVVRAMRFY